MHLRPESLRHVAFALLLVFAVAPALAFAVPLRITSILEVTYIDREAGDGFDDVEIGHQGSMSWEFDTDDLQSESCDVGSHCIEDNRLFIGSVSFPDGNFGFTFGNRYEQYPDAESIGVWFEDNETPDPATILGLIYYDYIQDDFHSQGTPPGTTWALDSEVDEYLGGTVVSTEITIIPEPLPALQPGDFIVSDLESARVLSVQPSGSQSGFTEIISEGGLLSSPTDIVAVGPNELLVADRASVAVIRIDADTGDQEIVSSGGRLVAPRTLAVEPQGTILVGDAVTGEIVRIDPVLGDQSLVADIGLLGEGFAPWSMALDASGDLLVLARFADAVVRVDPKTGVAVVFSVGDLLSDPNGLATAPDGPYVFDFDDWPPLALPALDDDPFITHYDCEGKGFCSTNDVFDLAGFGVLGNVATMRAWLTATFLRPSGELALVTWLGDSGHLDTSPVDKTSDDSAFRVEFSEPVLSASVEVFAQFIEMPGPRATFVIEAFDSGGLVAAVEDPASSQTETKTLTITDSGGFTAVEFRAYDPDYVPGPGAPGSAFLEADEIAIQTLPWIFVADAGAAAVIAIDPRDGAQSYLSQGDHLSAPRGITVAESRSILVVDDDRQLIKIDYSNGAQKVVTQNGDLQQPRGITVVPEPGPSSLIAGLAVLAVLHWRRSRAHRVNDP